MIRENLRIKAYDVENGRVRKWEMDVNDFKFINVETGEKRCLDELNNAVLTKVTPYVDVNGTPIETGMRILEGNGMVAEVVYEEEVGYIAKAEERTDMLTNICSPIIISKYPFSTLEKLESPKRFPNLDLDAAVEKYKNNIFYTLGLLAGTNYDPSNECFGDGGFLDLAAYILRREVSHKDLAMLPYKEYEELVEELKDEILSFIQENVNGIVKENKKTSKHYVVFEIGKCNEIKVVDIKDSKKDAKEKIEEITEKISKYSDVIWKTPFYVEFENGVSFRAEEANFNEEDSEYLLIVKSGEGIGVLGAYPTKEKAINELNKLRNDYRSQGYEVAFFKEMFEALDANETVFIMSIK